MQIRDLHMAIDGLARQFPAAAEPLGMAKQALTEAMTVVVVSMSSTESPSAPNLLA